MADLLSCPFCGGEAKYRADHTTERVDTVSCFRCDFHISDDGDVGSCVAAWNRRASPAPVAVPAGYRLTRDAPWTSRLARTQQRTATERQCGELIAAIESLGAHPLLTDALNAADLAMRVLGRWHDEGEPGRSSLASSTETTSDRAERRVAELQAAGLHTLGDIERAQSSGEPIAFLSKRALAQFDVNGCEIVDARLYPKGTLRPNEEIAVFSRPQADDGWRPMDSAPKDGTHILAKLHREAIEDMDGIRRKAFTEIREIWYRSYSCPIFGHDMPWHAGDPFDSHDGMAPDHMGADVPIAWRPLPSAPATGGGE